MDAGDWAACTSPRDYTDLTDGEHTFRVRAIDLAGNLGPEAAYTWTIDTVAPNSTIDSAPSDPSDDRAPSFEFSASEAAGFECRLDGGDWGACTSPHGYVDLADGEHSFDVRATDPAGNAGPAAAHSWTVDTVAPDTTIASGPPELTNSTTASFEFGADEAAEFECRLDAGDWASCSSPHAYTDLGDGSQTFQARATDGAGNVGGAATHAWTVDTVAPNTTIDAAPSNPSNDRAPSFAFRADEAAGFECRLDGGDWAACASPQEYTGLADGSHTFQVRATDRAGNAEAVPASYTWTIEPPPDNTPPTTTLTGQPANPSNAASATFRFTGSDNETPQSMIVFQCRVDGGAFAACSSPHTTAALADGSHAFEVRAVDLAGNVDATPASYTWTVDTTAPETTITAGPVGLTGDSTPTFSFSSEAGASFQCRVDSGAFAACGSPHTTAVLADGAHTFEVRATDAAGNTDASPASRAITVDTAAPQTTITEAPPASTSSTSATFNFTSSQQGSSFECSLDGAAFVACTPPRVYTGLAAGARQFSVRARDAAGNVDITPATHSWSISAPPQGCGPAVTALAAADAWIDQNSPTSNKGSDSILKVQSKGPSDNFRSLVRFTLPAVPQGCVVESATLRLFAASSRTPRTLQALRLVSTWSENLVSWANQPATTGAAATTAAGQGYREWTVTSQVQAMYAPGSNHGFLIRDSVESQDAEQQFHSREKGQNPPQLVVRFAAG